MMDGDDGLDEGVLLGRIRDRLRTALGDAPLPPVASRPEPPVDASGSTIDAELQAMAAATDVADAPLQSYRKIVGPLLRFARKIARKLLTGPLERQASYNAANQRLARAYLRELQSLRRDQQALQTACAALEARLRELESRRRVE